MGLQMALLGRLGNRLGSVQIGGEEKHARV